MRTLVDGQTQGCARRSHQLWMRANRSRTNGLEVSPAGDLVDDVVRLSSRSVERFSRHRRCAPLTEVSVLPRGNNADLALEPMTLALPHLGLLRRCDLGTRAYRLVGGRPLTALECFAAGLPAVVVGADEAFLGHRVRSA